MAEPRRIGIIGGSGLGREFGRRLDGVENDVDTPFGKPSGPIVIADINGVEIVFLPRHGRGHIYGPSDVPYRANIFALKELGVRYIIATAACGSLRQEIQPGDVVIVDQVIDKTFKRETSFFAGFLAAHVDFSCPFCAKISKILHNSALKLPFSVRDGGTYVCMEGPQFSSKAESLMHRQWGGDLIGMTCMPEAKLAREAEMCYGLMALVTDYDCWRKNEEDVDSQELMKEITSNLANVTKKGIKLIEAAIEDIGKLLSQPCEHHSALEMAIMTDKKEINDPAYNTLKSIIGKYL
ncbi:MAG: S-methyl-5'-thioadenosine phosphorylase [Phycisphaerae bacterium]|nr:S-methyl-5'-thioadenosine phosphorylase [Phycisphaerae bacterium]